MWLPAWKTFLCSDGFQDKASANVAACHAVAINVKSRARLRRSPVLNVIVAARIRVA